MAHLPGSRYRVISGYNLELVRREINEMIEQGYEPQGGLTVSGSPSRGEEVFYQAMYRPSVLPHGYEIHERNTTIEKPNRQLVPYVDEKEGKNSSGDIKGGKKR